MNVCLRLLQLVEVMITLNALTARVFTCISDVMVYAIVQTEMMN